MQSKSKSEYVHQVFESVSSGYDRANRRISLGLQGRWKDMLIARTAQYLPYRGSLLDLCCGTGDIAIAAAKRRPDVSCMGADFSDSMLSIARKKGKGLKNVQWEKADAMSLPWDDGKFDAACISFGLRNTSDYRQVVSEMARVVKKDGFIYCLDSFVPENIFVLPFYKFYFRFVMPLLGGGIRHNREYRWLYRSTQHFLKASELEELFQEAGLTDVGRQSRMFGACCLVWGSKQQ
jgi:demethylmenaquinone methyltransferase/2-methoxy-6-polyprenyl-1,4-benzoquinol methylase